MNIASVLEFLTLRAWASFKITQVAIAMFMKEWYSIKTLPGAFRGSVH